MCASMFRTSVIMLAISASMAGRSLKKTVPVGWAILLRRFTNLANSPTCWLVQPISLRKRKIADQTARGERTVRRVLADMERRGVIRRIVRRRGNGSRQSDMILLAAFEGRKPAPPGMLDDGPDGAESDPSDQPANGDNRPTRPLDNRPPDPDPPATVAALDTSKILKRTTTARDVPARAFSEPAGDQCTAPAADAEAACLAACGPGLSASARIAIVTTRPVIAEWLAEGYDLTADILPTLTERTSQTRADPIRTWA